MARLRATLRDRNYARTGPLPTAAAARRLATETGMAVADRSGVYRTPNSSPAIERERAELNGAIDLIERAVCALANSTLDPANLAASLEMWECRDWVTSVAPAITWLRRFEEGLKRHGKTKAH